MPDLIQDPEELLEGSRCNPSDEALLDNQVVDPFLFSAHIEQGGGRGPNGLGKGIYQLSSVIEHGIGACLYKHYLELPACLA